METLRAKITTYKQRFVQKVTQHHVKVNDSENPTINTTLTLFIPKLTPKYTKPCIFLHFKNGNSSTMCRCKHPELLAEKLQDLVYYLRSDNLLDTWQELQYISDKLCNNEDIVADDKFIDKEAFIQYQILNLPIQR